MTTTNKLGKENIALHTMIALSLTGSPLHQFLKAILKSVNI